MVGLPAAFGVVNTVLVILAGILYYKLTLKITRSQRASLISSIMLLTSFITISYGAASGKETGGIFFQVLSTYMILSYARGMVKTATIGLVSGIGGLAYESVYACVAFGFLLLLFKKRYAEASTLLLTSLVPQAIPPMLGGYNIIERYVAASIVYAKSVNMYDFSVWFDLGKRLSQFIVAISPLGAIALFTGFLLEDNEENIRMFYLMLVTSLIAWFSWPPNTARIAIVFFHTIFWLTGLGLELLADTLARKPVLKLLHSGLWIALLLSVNILFNNWLAYRWYLDPSSYTHSWGPIRGLSIPSPEMLSYKLQPVEP